MDAGRADEPADAPPIEEAPISQRELGA